MQAEFKQFRNRLLLAKKDAVSSCWKMQNSIMVGATVLSYLLLPHSSLQKYVRYSSLKNSCQPCCCRDFQNPRIGLSSSPPEEGDRLWDCEQEALLKISSSSVGGHTDTHNISRSSRISRISSPHLSLLQSKQASKPTYLSEPRFGQGEGGVLLRSRQKKGGSNTVAALRRQEETHGARKHPSQSLQLIP
jgi:hypothetical protein